LFVPATRDLAILCFEHWRDDPKTADLLSKAHESFPDDPNIAKALGILAYRRAEYPAAVQHLKQSLQTRKNDWELLCYFGMAQHRIRPTAESKAALQQALDKIRPALADEAKRVLDLTK